MLSFETMRELADQAHRDYDRLVADGTCPPLWSAVFGHLVAKEAQAATLATVTPLVQQMVNAHYQHQQAQVAFLLAVKSSDAAAGQLERAYIASAAELDRAAGNLDAFLSGATKESTDA